MGLDQAGQLVQQLAVAGQPQLGLDPVFQRDQPRLLQSAAERVPGLVRRDPGQHRSPPQPEGLAQQGDLALVVGRGAGLKDQGAEPVRVDVHDLGPQQVAASLAGQVHPVLAGAGPDQGGTQLGRGYPDGMDRGPGRCLRPAELDQPADRHQPVGLERQHRQHQPLPAMAQVHRALPGDYLNRTQQTELHNDPTLIQGPSAAGLPQPGSGRCRVRL